MTSASTVFVPHSATLNAEVQHLYECLVADASCMSRINAHLFVASSHAHSTQRTWRRYVLAAEDAPQLGNLPDWGSMLRDCLTRISDNKQHQCLAGQLIHACLPYPKNGVKNTRTLTCMHKDPRVSRERLAQYHMYDECLLQTLLGLLLGLHTRAAKQPVFMARAYMYRRVYDLLNGAHSRDASKQIIWDFATEHPGLLELALVEYFVNVIPPYMPAEYEALCQAYPVENWFLMGPTLVDAFRQEHIITGEEAWPDLEMHAQVVLDKLNKIYKSKCRSLVHHYTRHNRHFYEWQPQPYQQPHSKRYCRHWTQDAVTHAVINDALQSNVLHAYGIHTDTSLSHRVLQNEYASLNGCFNAERIHALVQVHALPCNLQREQAHILGVLAQTCQWRTKLRRTWYTCLSCEQRQKRNTLRLCMRTNQLLCHTVVSTHTSSSSASTDNNNSNTHVHQVCPTNNLVGVDVMGKTVYTVYGAKTRLLSPCCCTIQEYQAHPFDCVAEPNDAWRERVLQCDDAEDIPRNLVHRALEQECRHFPCIVKPSKRIRPKCHMCDVLALPNTFEMLDLRTFQLQTVHACGRHMPTHECLRHLYHLEQYESVAGKWTEMYKPFILS
jgi:hypothetical protein